jgi:hypothetical protein
MPTRYLFLALLMLGFGLTATCRQSRPGDSGGGATGDSLAGGAAGSARSNAELESRRPADTTLPGQIHDARGADTARH